MQKISAKEYRKSGFEKNYPMICMYCGNQVPITSQDHNFCNNKCENEYEKAIKKSICDKDE